MRIERLLKICIGLAFHFHSPRPFSLFYLFLYFPVLVWCTALAGPVAAVQNLDPTNCYLTHAIFIISDLVLN